MAKFFGEIGFATQVQTEPGIWEDKIVEKQYYCLLYTSLHIFPGGIFGKPIGD